jgi:hypothetical protein
MSSVETGHAMLLCLLAQDSREAALVGVGLGGGAKYSGAQGRP